MKMMMMVEAVVLLVVCEFCLVTIACLILLVHCDMELKNFSLPRVFTVA